ncbi:MAG: trypsin-like peptidase domain-containing protein [Chloroflexi bacterium]|nr:trypsin-like peptidase domain-containing protein [Chloroflexota bacterium]
MTELLQNLSNALAATVESAGPSVVRVEGRRRGPASGVIWSADGLIVTTHHVLEGDDIKVGLPDGNKVKATLVGRDPTTDLALLRAETTGLTPAAWGDTDAERVGHMVLALGRPGESVRATLGIISALGKSWQTPSGGRVDRYLQTDVVMYPGFSGGPLVDSESHVLGINTSALLRGISLTIPTLTVRQVVETLLTHGRVRRGHLGVAAQPARLQGDLPKQIGQETGLLLISVEQGSPADKGGLLMGDTIVVLDGQPVRHLDDLLALLSGDKIGASVPVRIVRGGRVEELKVTIGERT